MINIYLLPYWNLYRFSLCICREFGLLHTVASVDDSDLCAVCLERSCSVAAEGGVYTLANS